MAKYRMYFSSPKAERELGYSRAPLCAGLADAVAWFREKGHDRVSVLWLIALSIWLALVFGRGGFWLCRDRDDVFALPSPENWPSVVAVVPARDEAM